MASGRNIFSHHYTTLQPLIEGRMDPYFRAGINTHFHPQNCLSLEIITFVTDDSASRSAVSETLRPVMLVTYSISHFFPILMLSLNCSRLSWHDYMPKCIELLPCDWLIRYFHQWAVEHVCLWSGWWVYSQELNTTICVTPYTICITPVIFDCRALLACQCGNPCTRSVANKMTVQGS